MLPTRPSLYSRFAAWFADEESGVYRVQIVMVLVIITLLNIGFIRQREVREIAARHNLHSVVRGWDGLAWYAWAGVAPVMLMLIRRFPLAREMLWRNLGRLLAGSVLIFLAVTNARYLLRILPNVWLPDEADLPIDWATYKHTMSVLLPLDFLTYSGFFAASFAVDYYFKYRQRAEEVQRLQLESAQLQYELAQSQLAALRGQLHPHFLFNTFNAIAVLVRQRKNDSAVETIAQLSTLLRMAVDNVNQPVMRLERELEFIRCYLEVERIRFGDKLQKELVVEPEALGCVVPGLLLQPLVENAIKHGISQRVSPGLVRVEIGRRNDRLAIAVINDGPEMPRAANPGVAGGVGLGNTRRRLGHVYGTDFRLDLERISARRFAVYLDLPWGVSAPRTPAARQPMEAVP